MSNNFNNKQPFGNNQNFGNPPATTGFQPNTGQFGGQAQFSVPQGGNQFPQQGGNQFPQQGGTQFPQQGGNQFNTLQGNNQLPTQQGGNQFSAQQGGKQFTQQGGTQLGGGVGGIQQKPTNLGGGGFPVAAKPAPPLQPPGTGFGIISEENKAVPQQQFNQTTGPKVQQFPSFQNPAPFQNAASFPNPFPIAAPFPFQLPNKNEVQQYPKKEIKTIEDKENLVASLNQYIATNNFAFAVECLIQIIDNDIRVTTE